MILSGTVLGFICVGALFLASLTLAILDKREKGKGNQKKSKLLSHLALALFLVAFVGGVVVTLVGGLHPRTDGVMEARNSMGENHPEIGSGMSKQGPIGHIDEEELQKLKENVSKDPSDVKSRERLGHLYLQLQDFEKVFQMAHEALKIDPKSVESRVHMGMVLFSMQDVDASMQQLNQALTIDPNNLEGLIHKGIVQLQGQNDSEGANKTFQHYLKVAPPRDPSRKMVEMLLKQPSHP